MISGMSMAKCVLLLSFNRGGLIVTADGDSRMHTPFASRAKIGLGDSLVVFALADGLQN